MRLAVAAGTIVGLACLAPAARADIYAVADSGQGGLVELDASTAAAVPLPASVLTGGGSHPSISADGSRLAFMRGPRILVASLPAGTTTDLFDAFSQASSPQGAPAISPDGETVATGEPFQVSGGLGAAAVTLTKAAVHTQLASPAIFPQTTAFTTNPVVEGPVVAFTEQRAGLPGELMLGHVGDSVGALPLGRNGVHLDHPAFAPGMLLFDEHVLTGGLGDIAFTPLGSFPGGTVTKLFAVDSLGDVHSPSLTPDGRYLGFVVHKDAGNHLFVFDTQTPTLIRPTGAGTAA
jgi:hypothetical protein